MELGFPRDARARPSRFRLPRVSLLPVAGVVAPLLLIVVIVFAAGGEDGNEAAATERRRRGSDPVGTREQRRGFRRRRHRRRARRAPSAAPAQEAPRFEPSQRQRRIERSIAMTLTAPDDEIPSLADGVNRVAARNGGFVLSSELDSGDAGASASYELRIPTGRLQNALRGLAALGTVSSQSQSGQDVTRDFVTAADRLEAARAERRSLLRRLEAADTDAQAEAIRARLDLVAGEINGLRSQLRDLRLRTDYAIVSVDLIGEAGDEGSGGGAGGSFDDAVGDAGDLLVGFAGVLIRVLAIALPLGLMAALGWLVTVGLRRRRREQALA